MQSLSATGKPGRALLRPARLSPPTRHSILRGVMVFRWLAALWAAGVFAYEVYDRNVRASATRQAVERPEAGVVLFALLGILLVALTVQYLRNPDSLVRPGPVFAEIGLATVFFLADVWVYGTPDHSQALPTVWPIAVIATVALTAGGRAAVATGVGFGIARYVGWVPYNETPWSLVRTSSLVLMAMAGWVSAYLFRRLEQADAQISSFRAREEVARTLHDGVLQTLAVIQRRSDDTELVSLARTQELELRDYLFDAPRSDGNHADAADDDLPRLLRAAARRAEGLFGITVEVVCAPDLPDTSADQRAALVGGATEALNNAGKHSGADRITVYTEPMDADADEGSAGTVFVSVKDNGCGFDPDRVEGGQGLTLSISKRLASAGGRSKIVSRPGSGTEVQLWA